MKKTPNCPTHATCMEIARTLRKYAGGLTLTMQEAGQLRKLLTSCAHPIQSEWSRRTARALLRKMDKAGAP